MQDFKDFKGKGNGTNGGYGSNGGANNTNGGFGNSGGSKGANGGSNGTSGGATQGLNPELMKMLASLTSKYNGASENDLWRAVYSEAEKGFRNGTLSEADIDSFAATVAPMLDGKKRAKLNEIVEKLKKGGKK